MPATIRDVAQRAGVSPSTVSAYLNRTKYVSPDLAERIREAVEALDFHPSRAARALRQRTRSLAFLVPDIANTGYVRSLRAASEVARGRGYTLLLLDTLNAARSVDEAVSQLIEMRVDGVLLALTWDLARDEVLSRLRAYEIHAVGISGAHVTPGIDCFVSNQVEAGRRLARYLLRLGHREILFIGPGGSTNARLRFAGMTEACQAAGAGTPGLAWRPTDDYGPGAGYRAVVTALGDGVPFTAVVAFNDAIADGALAALADQGLAVPEDVSFATFGNAHVEYHRPRITSVVYDEEAIGRHGAQRLIDRIEGRCDAPPAVTYFEPSLLIQASTRALTRA